MADRQLAMIAQHPYLRVIVGRCGSGKSTTARRIMDAWRAGGGGPILAIDPVATNPPGELHVAGSADIWAFELPETIPDDVRLIVVDEADLYVAQADAYRRPLPPLHGLIRRRRHAGVSLLLLTQRPATIARSAWSLADEIIVCCITEPRDLAEIRKLPGVTSEDIDSIAAMTEPGIALIWTPAAITRRN